MQPRVKVVAAGRTAIGVPADPIAQERVEPAGPTADQFL
jgi:hypothetical protein